MALTPQQALVLALHRDMDRRLAAGCNGRFISGYDTVHPFVRQYLGDTVRETGLDRLVGTYSYPQDHNRLIEAIRNFHQATDGIDYTADEILVSAGSSPLILAIMVYLRQHYNRRAWYFRPLYHTFYYFADLLDIRLKPIGDEPLWDPDILPELPEHEEVLLFSDPIWFAGREVGATALDFVRSWQRRTGSTVIVDGTFQYLKWDRDRRKERASTFDRDHTLRIIGPTKSLALHGIRFAYLLGPSRTINELLWTCQNITGSSSVFDLQAATRVMEVLAGPDANRNLIGHIQDSYRELLTNGFLLSTVREPDCGYYVFGQLAQPRSTDLVMDAVHFDLSGYEGMVRVNLLSPDLAR